MSDLNQKIAQIEQEYDVDIERTVRPGMSDMYTLTIEADGDQRGYTVEVAALSDLGGVDAAFGDDLGLSFNGDEANATEDLTALHKALVEEHGSYEDLVQRSKDEGHYNSPLHRIASVAGAARTGFEVGPEAFHAGPFFGGSGAGPNLVPLGGEGKIVSTIGVAHDSDWLIGAGFGKGPLAGLNEVESGVPSGMHGLYVSQVGTGFTDIPTMVMDGLRNVANGNTLRYWVGGELEMTESALDQIEAELEEVPALQGVSGYDDPSNHPDWNVDVNWLSADPEAARMAQFNTGGVDEVQVVAAMDAATLAASTETTADVSLTAKL